MEPLDGEHEKKKIQRYLYYAKKAVS